MLATIAISGLPAPALVGCAAPRSAPDATPEESPAAPTAHREAPADPGDPADEDLNEFVVSGPNRSSLGAGLSAGAPRSTLDINVRDRPLHEVLAPVSRASGRPILLDPRLDLRVTLRVRELHWRSVLQLLARLYRLELRVRPGRHGPIQLAPPPDHRIQLSDARLSTSLLLLARKAGRNIVIAPGLDGRVSMSLSGVSPERAMSVLAESQGAVILPGRPTRVRAGDVEGDRGTR